MKYLEKTWVRILASLLSASFIYELITINSDDPNHLHSKDNSSVFILIVGPIIYFVLTMFLNKKSKSQLKNLK